MEKCKYDDEDLKNLARGTVNTFHQMDYIKERSERDLFMQELGSFAARRNEEAEKHNGFVNYIVCDNNGEITYDTSQYIYADLPYFHSYEDAMDAVRYFGERDFYKYYFNRSV